MTAKKYRVIWESPINVEMKSRDVGEVFEADDKVREIKNLVGAKYLEEVKE